MAALHKFPLHCIYKRLVKMLLHAQVNYVVIWQHCALQMVTTIALNKASRILISGMEFVEGTYFSAVFISAEEGNRASSSVVVAARRHLEGTAGQAVSGLPSDTAGTASGTRPADVFRARHQGLAALRDQSLAE